MARRAKISTIGLSSPHADPTLQNQELVQQMIEFLRGQIKQVLPDKPDMIVLPEFCDQFENLSNPSLLEYFGERGDQILHSLQDIARENQCYITYPAARQMNDGTWRNAVRVIDRQGEVIGHYHKNNTMQAEVEAFNMLCGSEAELIECDFGRVAIAVCFDLNFDDLRLHYAQLKPDLILFCSIYHGGLMQAYWAYSCRSHLVSAVNGARHRSHIFSPSGTMIATSTNYFNYVTATVNLDCCLAHLDYNWPKITALKEKYGARATVKDPGEMGSVLITSEDDNISVQEMIREFEIEPLDDYLARAREFGKNPAFCEPLPAI